MRNNESFDLFWDYVEQRRALVDVSSPTLPRRRKVPRRLEVGESEGEYPTTVKDHYRRIYFAAIDHITAAIDNRFQQKGFNMLQKLDYFDYPTMSRIRSSEGSYGLLWC